MLTNFLYIVYWKISLIYCSLHADTCRGGRLCFQEGVPGRRPAHGMLLRHLSHTCAAVPPDTHTHSPARAHTHTRIPRCAVCCCVFFPTHSVSLYYCCILPFHFTTDTFLLTTWSRVPGALNESQPTKKIIPIIMNFQFMLESNNSPRRWATGRRITRL